MSKRVILVGGSGFWSEQNHIRNLLSLRNESDARVAVIIDIINPASLLRHENLQAILARDDPQWVNPSGFSSIDDVFAHIGFTPDLVIISSNPETHYKYALYCAQNNIPVLIDKPVIMVANAASDISASRDINQEFNTLLKESASQSTPVYTHLRRRALPAFVKIRDELASNYEQTKAPLTHLTIQVNGGIHKLPAEFESDYGAHGYQNGVGSLSHSAYHYIDVMLWLFSAAIGTTETINIKLNYVKRVSDYLGSNGYSYIQALLGLGKVEVMTSSPLPAALLAAELDSGFTLELRDKRGYVVGAMTFNFNHTGFSPRQRGVELTNHSNFRDGGRMSQIYLDIHQSTVQHWQMIKNDVVFNGNTIGLVTRRHPSIGTDHEENRYTDAYDNIEFPMERGLLRLLKNDSSITNEEMVKLGLKPLKDEAINMAVLGAFYELIASDYKKTETREIIIKVQDFFKKQD